MFAVFNFKKNLVKLKIAPFSDCKCYRSTCEKYNYS